MTEWPWTPKGIERRRDVGLYRADVAVLESGVPILIVEVDVTTSGKAAVGAMLMADLALHDLVGASRPFWFQVVTVTAEKAKYKARLEYASENFFKKNARAVWGLDNATYEGCAVHLGKEPLVEDEISDANAWLRVKPDEIARGAREEM